MSKPPRGQPPRDGTQRPTRSGMKGQPVRSMGGRSSDARNDRGKSSGAGSDRDAGSEREKTSPPPKKPGWARAAPRKKKPWLAKRRDDNTEKREPRRPQSSRTSTDDADARPTRSKPAMRVRPVAGRSHVERPDNRMRPAGERGRDRDDRNGQSRRSTGDRPDARRDARPDARRETHSDTRTGRPERGSERPSRGRSERDARPDYGKGPRRANVGGDRRTVVASDGAPASKMRIAKALARAGLCSRRDAERWVEEGRVEVNGKKITSPALDVAPGDRVLIDGQPLPAAEPTRLWRYSKPKGTVTTHRDPEGRPTVFDGLPDDMPRVMSIGRLDYNTEGLLLLTTDGELARYLELPSTGWLRRYRVRAHGRVTQADLDALKDGIEIDGVHYGPIEAVLDSVQGANVWLTVGLREGKNREVRNILASLDLEVNRLIRVSFGPFQLLDMKPGTVELVRRKVLVEQMGARLAKQFNLADDEIELAERPDRGGRTPRPQRPSRSDDDAPRGSRRSESRERPDRSEGGGRPDRSGARPRRRPEEDDRERPTRFGRRVVAEPRANPADDDAEAPRAPRKPKSKDKRGGNPRGSKPKGGTPWPRTDEPDLADIDENKLDDIKPWNVKTEADPRAGRKKPGAKSSRPMSRTRAKSAGKSDSKSSPRSGRKPPGKPERS